MKAGGRLRFFVTLTSILAATALIGVLVYQTTFDTLRGSYQQLLDRNVEQGVFVLETYLDNQHTLLSLYASAPSVQAGRFSDLPEWLSHPEGGGTNPKRLSIVDASGRGLASTGQSFEAGDREYFRTALLGKRNVAGPLESRVDHNQVVIVACPIPGNHTEAAVLTAVIDLKSFELLLQSAQSLSGAELVLTDPLGRRIAASGSPPEASGGGDLLRSSRTLAAVPWTLTARVQVADMMQPVRQVLLMIGILVVTGLGLVVVFFLSGIRHRQDLEQAREDRTQALRDAYEQIRKLAYHDTVTRLPNRNLVVRKLNEAVQARAEVRIFVVALAQFRNLTTTFGLKIADSILKETASRLAEFSLADSRSFLGRLGGSEFIVILDEAFCGPSTLTDLLRLFDEPMGPEDLRLHSTVHVGSCRLAEAGNTAEEVIKSAETALWAARAKGPSDVSELTPEAVEKRLRRAELQRLLPEALDRGEIGVCYQPQIDLNRGTVTGYEALMRWTSPELGPVGPSEFIAVAEETGAILSLGAWILDQGIAFALALRNAGTPSVVSVNVSAVQFLRHGFLEEVRDRLEAAGLPPGDLGLEITESTLMEGIDKLRPSLRRIMQAGVKISLDDFGTGYSSLNYLKALPLDVVKIDKSFIDTLEADERSFRLIEGIIALAHNLGLRVLAEGVETAAQRDLLAAVGCDQVQGFYTGHPEPAEVLLEKVAV